MAVQRLEFRRQRRARAHLQLSTPYLDSGVPGFRGRAAAAHPVAEYRRPDRCEQELSVALPRKCSGISFQRQDDPSNWATIAYNLGT